MKYKVSSVASYPFLEEGLCSLSLEMAQILCYCFLLIFRCSISNIHCSARFSNFMTAFKFA